MDLYVAQVEEYDEDGATHLGAGHRIPTPNSLHPHDDLLKQANSTGRQAEVLRKRNPTVA